MRWVVVAIAVASLACADGGGPDGESVDACAPLAKLPPLAAADCRASADANAFEQRLREATKDDSGSSLVRASLGEDSRVTSLCADRTGAMGEWKVRQALGARLPALRALAAGPACLAGTRVDLNRRAATVAESERAEDRCDQRARTTRDTRSGAGTPLIVARQLQECVEYEADWIFVYRPGSMEPAVFGRPQVVDPPDVRARDTASRCRRENDRDAEIACIESEGWELLD